MSRFHVVAIGASAGGLNALEQFFAAMPTDSGMAFVVIQHLSPDFKSLMDDLLARHTTMTIRQAVDGVELLADTIYLSPPRFQMGLVSGRITLRDKPVGVPTELGIDSFFRSMTEDVGGRAIGVVLSGTGSDGSRGIRAIKEAGGLVVVQSPDSAQFDGMPRNAIASGCYDFLLPPDRIPRLLVDYTKDPEEIRFRASHTVEVFPEDGEYAEIFALLRRSYNVDFSKYSTTTVGRRIERRIELKGIATIADYVSLLVDNSGELDALYCDLLIGVTEFFRDPATFDFLAKIIVPELIAASPDANELRIWSACCATGEEAYSLGIILTEAAEACSFMGKITVFATDIHKSSLDTAAAGIYSRDRLTNVSPERLARYFRYEVGDTWRIIADIRKMVVFAPHNVITDSPFTKTDLICCRNMLIYLQPNVQEKVIATFHYALKVSGVLLLGSSEGLGNIDAEFETIDAHHKLFRKKRELRLASGLRGASVPPQFHSAERSVNSPSRMMSMDRRLVADYDLLLGRYMPPGILVDENHHVLHIFGQLKQYLPPMTGRADNNILAVLAKELHVAVSTTIQRAARDLATAMLSGVQLTQENGPQLKVTVTVEPLNDQRAKTAHFFISFRSEELQPLLPDYDDPAHNYEEQSIYRQHISDLELDLQTTRENLQAANEELQASNEELQATNEELLASNEELQSTNEELHSVNEELYTVNFEFERKNSELNDLYLDLENLLASIDIGVIFVDSRLCIRKFNKAISSYFNLLSHDIGRPIDHITYRLSQHKSLMENIHQVLSSGTATESEDFAVWDSRHILIRILPFKCATGKTEGVVALFADVSRIKEAELQMLRMNEVLEQTVMERTRELERAQKFTTSVIDGLSEHICVVNRSGDIITVNRSWHDFAVSNSAVGGSCGVGVNYFNVLQNNAEDAEIEMFRNKLQAVLDGTLEEFSLEYPCHAPHEKRWFTCTVNAFTVNDEHYAVFAHKNITMRKQVEEWLQENRSFLSEVIENNGALMYVKDRNGDYELVNRKWEETTGLKRADVIGRTDEELFPGNAGTVFHENDMEVMNRGEMIETEEMIEDATGKRYFISIKFPMRDEDVRVKGLCGMSTEITERKQAELDLAEMTRTFESLSITDSLTNLANRRYFDEILNAEYGRLVRSGGELSLIMLDIDHFKAFNDSYGHLKGDDCLRRIARVVADSASRAADLAARFGGEEFVCILPETDRSGAIIIAEQIRRGIQALAIPHKGSSVSDCVTASLGVVTATCKAGGSAVNILAQADVLLYRAKSSGRNRIELPAYTVSKAPLAEAGSAFAHLVWKDFFCCGNPLIDAQHQTLFKIANELFDAIQTRRSPAETSPIINRLLDDATQHFQDEQAILEQAGFSGLPQHSAEHSRLLSRGLELAEHYSSGALSGEAIFKFLAFDAVMIHILGADREYIPFVRVPES